MTKPTVPGARPPHVARAGVSYMENVPIWHYRSPSTAEYAQAVKELEAAS